ncbi:MAG: FAD-dependent pyridine nucleotide-disulfide oxidoreductase [Parcubacteria group bacterium GW2011_GWA2_47_10b]|nr:MAG: FAD-dependent pyridine nucleotide-disulfide oxidoreductase [Parcubacteria group bacterium GW2011_GWA2_47_10b]
MARKPLVVIVGGGYGGVRIALDLAKRNTARVILVEKNRHHMFHAYFYELATFFCAERQGEPQEENKKFYDQLLRIVTVPYDEIFAKFSNVKVEYGTVQKVISSESKVVMSDGRALYYEWLVIATGSKTDYFGIPHLEDNAIGLKSVEDALNIRNRVDELSALASKNKTITVVIGGGGATGVELAAELVGYMKKLSLIHGHPVAHWRCIIVESRESVLAKFSLRAQHIASRRLRALGVTVMPDSHIVDVWPNLLYIGKEKRTLPFDLLVWTAGVEGACDGEIMYDVHLAKNSCLAVDERLRVVPHKNIFTVGDVAASCDPKTGVCLPMTVEKALSEGSYVSRAIHLLARDPNARIAPYRPKASRYILPLGGKYALLEGKHVVFAGVTIWFLKYFILFRYLVSITSLRKAFGRTARQFMIYIQND